jgi:hypothetical protein
MMSRGGQVMGPYFVCWHGLWLPALVWRAGKSAAAVRFDALIGGAAQKRRVG